MALDSLPYAVAAPATADGTKTCSLLANQLASLPCAQGGVWHTESRIEHSDEQPNYGQSGSYGAAGTLPTFKSL